AIGILELWEDSGISLCGDQHCNRQVFQARTIVTHHVAQQQWRPNHSTLILRIALPANSDEITDVLLGWSDPVVLRAVRCQPADEVVDLIVAIFDLDGADARRNVDQILSPSTALKRLVERWEGAWRPICARRGFPDGEVNADG